MFGGERVVGAPAPCAITAVSPALCKRLYCTRTPGLLDNVTAGINSMQVCPIASCNKIVLGLVNGLLLVYDLLTGELLSKFQIYDQKPVMQCIWVSAQSVLCYSSTEVAGGGWNNLLSMVCLQTCSGEELRKLKSAETHGIKEMCVSTSMQYAAMRTKDTQVQCECAAESCFVALLQPAAHFQSL